MRLTFGADSACALPFAPTCPERALFLPFGPADTQGSTFSCVCISVSPLHSSAAW